MSKYDFVHDHQSSRFDRTDESLRKNTQMHLSHCDLFTITEISREGREAVLRKLAATNGFGLVTGDKSGMDDTGIMWKNSRFHDLKAWTELLPGGEYSPLSNGHVTKTGVSYLHATDLMTGLTILVSVCHLPASVERAGKFKRGAARVVAWRKVQKAWKASWNKHAAELKPDAVLLTADWNINWKSLFFRQTFKVVQPGMTCTWKGKKLPKIGTLGSRLIDLAFTRGHLEATEVRVLNDPYADSDHRGFRQVLRWTK